MKKLIAATVVLIAISGCVSRKVLINSEPQGARVFLDHREIGLTPVEARFTHFGKHSLVLTLKGYTPYKGILELQEPWWAVFPVDIVTEAVNPFQIKYGEATCITLKRPPLLAPDVRRTMQTELPAAQTPASR